MQITSFAVTAATLRAVLCFTEPKNTPKICFNNDNLTLPLINKLKAMVGEKDGSETVYCRWEQGEEQLLEQFYGICNNISIIFKQVQE